MSRTFAVIALATLLTGCTRYGTRTNGPFAPKPKSDPYAAIPPGPPANASPLALANDPRLQQPVPPDNTQVIPGRLPEPVALTGAFGGYPGGEVMPAGGLPTQEIATSLPPRRRKPDPQPGQLPSPYAPKDNPNAPNPEPVAPSTPAQHIAEVKKLAEIAADKWTRVDTYEAIVTRRELAPNKDFTEDVVLYQFRKEPMGVYLRALDEANKGREIIYSPAKHGDKIYSIIGKADAKLLFPAGSKAPVVTPDSPFVKDKTRYSIREAGYGTPIKRVGSWVMKAETGKIPAENLTFLGLVNRKEYPYPLVGVQLMLRPGDDPHLPNGGMRQWFFDTKADSPSNGFPVLIIATEPNGKEVEYYLFEKLKFGVPLTDADFSPDRLGKK